MTQKNFNTIAGTLFLLIAVIHAYRAINGVQVWFGDMMIPLWLSWVGVVVAATLAFYGIKHGRR